MILAACCCVTFTGIGLTINCLGLFFGPVAKELDVGRGKVAIFSTIVNLVTGFTGPFISTLLKKFRLRTIMSAGCIMVAVGFGILSMADNVYIFYAMAPFIGAGATLLGTVVTFTVLNNWFKTRYGTVTGIMMAFGGVCGVVMSPAINWVIERYSWRAAFLFIGLIGAVVALPGILFVLKLHPEENNLQPYGESEIEAKKEESSNAQSGNESGQYHLFSVSVMLVCLMTFSETATHGINSHLPDYAMELELGSSVGALLISACMVGNISAKLLSGVLSDWIGSMKACLLMYGVSTAGLALLFISPTQHLYYPMVGALLFGASFAINSLGTAQVIKRSFPERAFTRVYAYATAFGYVGIALLTPVFGYIYDYTVSYRKAIFVAIFLKALSVSCIALLRAYLKIKYSCAISTKSKWKRDGQTQERTQQAYHSV